MYPKTKNVKLMSPCRQSVAKLVTMGICAWRHGLRQPCRQDVAMSPKHAPVSPRGANKGRRINVPGAVAEGALGVPLICLSDCVDRKGGVI